MRISDWSSDVCSSDLATLRKQRRSLHEQHNVGRFYNLSDTPLDIAHKHSNSARPATASANQCRLGGHARGKLQGMQHRSEEHTSELQSLMRISYAVFCLKKKINDKAQAPYYEEQTTHHHNSTHNKTT